MSPKARLIKRIFQYYIILKIGISDIVYPVVHLPTYASILKIGLNEKILSYDIF